MSCTTVVLTGKEQVTFIVKIESLSFRKFAECYLEYSSGCRNRNDLHLPYESSEFTRTLIRKEPPLGVEPRSRDYKSIILPIKLQGHKGFLMHRTYKLWKMNNTHLLSIQQFSCWSTNVFCLSELQPWETYCMVKGNRRATPNIERIGVCFQ